MQGCARNKRLKYMHTISPTTGKDYEICIKSFENPFKIASSKRFSKDFKHEIVHLGPTPMSKADFLNALSLIL